MALLLGWFVGARREKGEPAASSFAPPTDRFQCPAPTASEAATSGVLSVPTCPIYGRTESAKKKGQLWHVHLGLEKRWLSAYLLEWETKSSWILLLVGTTSGLCDCYSQCLWSVDGIITEPLLSLLEGQFVTEPTSGKRTSSCNQWNELYFVFVCVWSISYLMRARIISIIVSCWQP